MSDDAMLNPDETSPASGADKRPQDDAAAVRVNGQPSSEDSPGVDPGQAVDGSDYEDPEPSEITDPAHPDYVEPAVGVDPAETTSLRDEEDK